ncbi:MAG: hypothetical protein CV087_10345, partial [Candidatus Brocadia sp. WS118]
MKKILFLFVLLFAFSLSAQQLQNEFLFGTAASPVNFDTLTAADSIAVSRSITYSTYLDVKGGVTIWGNVELVSGTFSALTVQAAMLHGSEYTAGPFHSVGTIDTADVYDFSLSRLSWWGPNRGFVVKYIAQDTSTAIYRVTGEA